MANSDARSNLRLGFMGLGAMGSRMARRLLEAGYELTVYNRTRERMADLERRGARPAESPQALVDRADVVLSSLTDDAAVEEAILGPHGALATARPGTVFIDMSTVLPRTSDRLHVAARARGASALDAPVSGSTPQAEQGQLVILVGGDEEVFARCEPILSVLGKETAYMGPAGSGTATKLCLNTLLGGGIQVLAEAIALGLRSGLPRERLLKVLGDSVVVSPSQKSKLENARNDEYPSTFPLRLMYKDFTLIAERAMELSVPMPATAAAAQMYAVEHARQPAGQVDEDFSAVIRSMLRLAGYPATDPAEYSAAASR